MTDSPTRGSPGGPAVDAPSGSAARAAIFGILTGPIGLWAAFLLVHLVLGAIDLFDSVHLPFGDVLLVYRFWMDYAAQHGVLVGIDTGWVYPIGALVPMGLAYLAGSDLYGVSWLVMVTILDALAVVVLSRVRAGAAWWWIAFLAALGPVAVGRIDAVTAPIAIIGITWLSRRPIVAAALLALAAWMKVWPIAILFAAVIALKDRARVIAGACATTIVIVGGALVAGSGANIVGFLFEQTGRGLQVEAPVSAYWLWDSVLRSGGSRIYYDRDILTYQVAGPGTHLVAQLMTPLLVVAVLGMCALGLRAVLSGVAATELLPPLALGLVLTLIVANKVGSPQFVGWLATPVVLWMLWRRSTARGPALAVLCIAVLTQAVYPWLYAGVVGADPIVAALLTARNVVYIALLGWTIRELWRLRPASTDSGDGASRENTGVGAESSGPMPRNPLPPSIGTKEI